MINSIKLEFFKIRHRKVFISVICIMVFEFLWTLLAQSYKSTADSLQLWMELFYNVSSINCVIMPIFTAIIASKLVDIEHKGNTLKLLKTIQGKNNLFNSKFACGIIINCLALLIQSAFIIFIGCIYKYSNIPTGHFLYFIMYTLLINITLFLLQMILSFQFVNQMIAFFVAIAGSFLGLFSLFFGGLVSKIILWGYYGTLSPVRMNWTKSTRAVTFYWTQLPLYNLFILIIVFILLYILGVKLFKLKEE